MTPRRLILPLAALAIAVTPVHAQEKPATPPPTPKPVPIEVKVHIQGDGVIVIQGDGAAAFVSQRAWAGPDDPIPSDEQLARVEIEPTVQAIIERLDAPAFDEREAAMSELIDLRIDQLQLYAALARGDLTPEQRLRLLAAARYRLLNAERGALGITMGDRDEQPGVLVTDLVPGMPAERVLRLGDRIVAIEGIEIATSADLVRLVQSRRPGDEVLLTVRRPQRDQAGRIVHRNGGEQLLEHLDVPLALGSTHRLAEAQIGRTMATNPAEAERRREAAWAEQRFSPQPRIIEIAE
jgi:hypothetical protein